MTTQASRCIAAHKADTQLTLSHLFARPDVRLSSPFPDFIRFTFPDGSAIQVESRFREKLLSWEYA